MPTRPPAQVQNPAPLDDEQLPSFEQSQSHAQILPDGRLYDPAAPVAPPAYDRIGNDGHLPPRRLHRSGTGDNYYGLPVASTLEAAHAFASNNPYRESALGSISESSSRAPAAPPSYDVSVPPSVLKFANSTVFSAAQKEAIQAFYDKYTMPIGMAHQLEQIADHRFEFILDNSPETSPEEFHEMRRDILKRVELLQHIPNAGIGIRLSSNFNAPTLFEHESDSKHELLEKIDKFLAEQSISRKAVPSLQMVLENTVSDALATETKTLSYVFSARDMSGNKGKGRLATALTKQARIDAKNLTKAMVNRPVGMADMSFFNNGSSIAGKEVIERLDTAAKNVGVISPFLMEQKAIAFGQSECFPYSEGTHIQASLLAPKSRFWDEIDEGALFSKPDLELHFGRRLSPDEYGTYLNKAMDRQARLFMKQEAEASENIAPADGRPLPSAMHFVTSTDQIGQSPRLQKKLADFRNHRNWSKEAEEGINRLCRDKHLPIGLGMRLIEEVNQHYEINIDNSGSMVLRADDETSSGSYLRRDANGGVYDPDAARHPNRLTEAKQQVTRIADYLSYIPTDGVTLTKLNRSSGTVCPPTDAVTLNSRDPNFRTKVALYLQDVGLAGGTPSNAATTQVCDRAKARDGKTNVLLLSDGEPSDNTSLASNHISHENTIVSRRQIREMLQNLLNYRDPEKMPVNILQCTNDDKAIAWTNMADNVCRGVNAIDDGPNEVAQVRSKHGKSFPYDEGIYALALLMPGDKLFDSLDEGGIFSHHELEEYLCRDVSPHEYDHYFNEAYAAQYDPQSERVECQSVSAFSPQSWSEKREHAQKWVSPDDKSLFSRNKKQQDRVLANTQYASGSSAPSTVASSSQLSPQQTGTEADGKKKFSLRKSLGLKKN